MRAGQSEEELDVLDAVDEPDGAAGALLAAGEAGDEPLSEVEDLPRESLR